MVKRSDTIDAIATDLALLMNHLRVKNVDAMNQSAWMQVNLTMPQVRVLFTTMRAGRTTSSSIAEALGVGASAVTPLVDALVEHKLVKREPDSADRRVTWIVPTEKAHGLQEKLMGASRASISQLLETLNADDLVDVKRAFAVLAAAARSQQKTPETK